MKLASILFLFCFAVAPHQILYVILGLTVRYNRVFFVLERRPSNSPLFHLLIALCVLHFSYVFKPSPGSGFDNSQSTLHRFVVLYTFTAASHHLILYIISICVVICSSRIARLSHAYRCHDQSIPCDPLRVLSLHCISDVAMLRSGLVLDSFPIKSH